QRLRPQLAAANKTFPSQFNPAIGLIVDTVGSYGSKTRGDFELRAAELGISASVDPFARGYAIITGSNQGGFDVEEAAIVTTSLPYNLTAKGGRFFAYFGRLSKFHDRAVADPRGPRAGLQLVAPQPGELRRARVGHGAALRPGEQTGRRVPDDVADGRHQPGTRARRTDARHADARLAVRARRPDERG